VVAESGSQWQSIHMFFSPVDNTHTIVNTDIDTEIRIGLLACRAGS
jgi:hypothetical protein